MNPVAFLLDRAVNPDNELLFPGDIGLHRHPVTVRLAGICLTIVPGFGYSNIPFQAVEVEGAGVNA